MVCYGCQFALNLRHTNKRQFCESHWTEQRFWNNTKNGARSSKRTINRWSSGWFGHGFSWINHKGSFSKEFKIQLLLLINSWFYIWILNWNNFPNIRKPWQFEISLTETEAALVMIIIIIKWIPAAQGYIFIVHRLLAGGQNKMSFNLT